MSMLNFPSTSAGGVGIWCFRRKAKRSSRRMRRCPPGVRYDDSKSCSIQLITDRGFTCKSLLTSWVVKMLLALDSSLMLPDLLMLPALLLMLPALIILPALLVLHAGNLTLTLYRINPAISLDNSKFAFSRNFYPSSSENRTGNKYPRMAA